MKIDRSNYERWIIDWLDGNLDDHQIEQISLFVAENPDLQEELKELDSALIIPPAAEFKGKSELKRTPSDITDLQFDYLCTAYAENDLSPEELDEFSVIISNDGRRRNLSEQFMKLKLAPLNIRFENKKKLRKRTPLQKTFLFPAALISAAASVALLITLTIFISGNERNRKNNLSLQETNGDRVVHPTFPHQTDNTASELKQSVKETIITTPVIAGKTIAASTSSDESSEKEITDSLQESHFTEIIHPVEVPSNSDIQLFYQNCIQNPALIPLSVNIQIQPDKRWAAGRFFAKVFRERILKEEIIDDSPIKGYEIAEAGITGLNKLLGWEMSFEKNSDEKGELKSIYFSSKILKIQTPVNKSEIGY